MFGTKGKAVLILGSLILLVVAGGVFTRSVAQTEGAEAATSKTGDLEIGYVNLSRALESFEPYQKAQEELETYHEQLQEDISSREKELKQLREEMQFLSRSEQAQKRKEFMSKMQNFRARAKQSEQKMQKKQKELLEPVRNRVQEVVTEFGEEEGLDVIKQYDNQASDVLWVSAKVDVTGEIIDRLDKLEAESEE